jgi:hypothetical protein
MAAGRLTSTRLGVAAAAALAVLLNTANALNNGLGRTPGMGWNSDYCTNCSHHYWVRSGLGATNGAQPANQNEIWVKHMADHMHTHKYRMASDGSIKTMQELGFHYVNIDANWDALNRSAAGDLVRWCPPAVLGFDSYFHKSA